MILCDIGNTTFHFLINGEHKKYLLEDELPYFNQNVYFISVNDIGAKKLRKSCKKSIDLKDYLDFNTQYTGMGIDRMIACKFLDNTIIIDAGSAITVDIMENSIHKGGFILPGLNNFNKLYSQISTVLDIEINTKVNLDTIPLNTEDAISYSILKSIILPIKEISQDKYLIFTGGDGKFLSKFFENCSYEEDLIFKSMKGIIDANNCIA